MGCHLSTWRGSRLIAALMSFHQLLDALYLDRDFGERRTPTVINVSDGCDGCGRMAKIICLIIAGVVLDICITLTNYCHLVVYISMFLCRNCEFAYLIYIAVTTAKGIGRVRQHKRRSVSADAREMSLSGSVNPLEEVCKLDNDDIDIDLDLESEDDSDIDLDLSDITKGAGPRDAEDVPMASMNASGAANKVAYDTTSLKDLRAYIDEVSANFQVDEPANPMTVKEVADQLQQFDPFMVLKYGIPYWCDTVSYDKTDLKSMNKILQAFKAPLSSFDVPADDMAEEVAPEELPDAEALDYRVFTMSKEVLVDEIVNVDLDLKDDETLLFGVRNKDLETKAQTIREMLNEAAAKFDSTNHFTDAAVARAIGSTIDDGLVGAVKEARDCTFVAILMIALISILDTLWNVCLSLSSKAPDSMFDMDWGRGVNNRDFKEVRQRLCVWYGAKRVNNLKLADELETVVANANGWLSSLCLDVDKGWKYLMKVFSSRLMSMDDLLYCGCFCISVLNRTCDMDGWVSQRGSGADTINLPLYKSAYKSVHLWSQRLIVCAADLIGNFPYSRLAYHLNVDLDVDEDDDAAGLDSAPRGLIMVHDMSEETAEATSMRYQCRQLMVAAGMLIYVL